MKVLSNRWCVLALMFLVGTSLPMQFQAVPALAPFLVAEVGLSYTDIGVLTGIFMFPGVLLAAPSGILAAWIGDRLALVVGLFVMAASAVAFAATDSYSVMFASRLLGGVGAIMINVLLPKMVTDWFAGKEISTALAINAASFGLGIGLAMAIFPFIASLASWQVAMYASASLAVLGIVLLLVQYRDNAEPGRQTGRAKTGTRLWRINPPEFVLASIAGIERGLLGSGYVVFMSFVPTLLISQGMRTEGAGLLTSVVAIVSLISVPLGGFLSDRTGKPNYFIVGGSIGAALSCIIIPYVAPAFLWVFLFGLLRGGVTGGVMALPAHVLQPESRTTGFAVVSAAFFICMAVFPPIAGYVLDATHRPSGPLWFAGLLWILIPVLLAIFKLLQRRWISTP